MQIRLFGLAEESIVDGPGFRYAVFTQGCPHDCAGCHNPESHALEGGYFRDTAELIAEFTQNPLLSGITLTGGEPFLQPEACAELALAARDAGLSAWIYSGYLFEDLMQMPEALPLLYAADVLVDGPFIEEQRSLELKFRGSENQRLLNLPASLQAGEPIIALYL